LMRKTTKASIENSAIGRDNVEDYAFDDEQIVLPPVNVMVKGHRERMTGQFSLDVNLDAIEVKAYSPVHLDLHMQGVGDFDQMQDINLTIDGVKVFSEKGERHYTLTKDGFSGEWEQKFSLVSDKDFVIKPIEIAYFDISKKERVVLRSKRYEVKVTPAYEIEELLDTEITSTDTSWWSWSYLNYIMTFILGVLAHYYYLKWREKQASVKVYGFEKEIKQCHSMKQLLTRLIMRDDRDLDILIAKYEVLDERALNALKREALKILKEG